MKGKRRGRKERSKGRRDEETKKEILAAGEEDTSKFMGDTST